MHDEFILHPLPKEYVILISELSLADDLFYIISYASMVSERTILSFYGPVN